MRKKSDEKRQSILDAAYVLFRANGFEKTSMLEIAARAGSSKATLYNYFPSKEELFVECLFDMADDYLENAFSGLGIPETDLAPVLENFGRKTLRLLCSPDLLAARRLMITEAGRSGIGQLFYQKICIHLDHLAGFFAEAMTAGVLRQADPQLAARHLRALLEAEIYEPFLLCVHQSPPEEALIQRASEHAVGLFLRAYAPESA